MTGRTIEASARVTVTDEPGQAIMLVLRVDETHTTATLAMSPVDALRLADRLIQAEAISAIPDLPRAKCVFTEAWPVYQGTA